MSDATTPAATDSSVTDDGSVGVCQARIVTGAARLQVCVAGQWWDVEGISTANVFTSDPRIAARVEFTKISSISQAAAGNSPVPARQVLRRSLHEGSTAPVQTTRTGTVTPIPGEKPVPQPVPHSGPETTVSPTATAQNPVPQPVPVAVPAAAAPAPEIKHPS